MTPLEVSLPYIDKIDAVELRRAIVRRIEAQPYPQFIKDWHTSKLKIITKGQPSIGDILTNVTKPGRIERKCNCRHVLKHFPNLPKTEGHILFTGRELHESKTFNVCASNIPRQTWSDIFRTWEGVNKQLPTDWRMEKEQWKADLFKILKKEKNVEIEDCAVPNSKE